MSLPSLIARFWIGVTAQRSLQENPLYGRCQDLLICYGLPYCVLAIMFGVSKSASSPAFLRVSAIFFFVRGKIAAS
jgi:hypothetical protein